MQQMGQKRERQVKKDDWDVADYKTTARVANRNAIVLVNTDGVSNGRAPFEPPALLLLLLSVPLPLPDVEFFEILESGIL